MPQTPKGSWFLHYRDKMDPELIATIEGAVYEIWRTKERIRALSSKGQPVPDYLKGYLRRLEHRTDGTDAFDTLYIGCEKFPYHDSFSLSMSGVL